MTAPGVSLPGSGSTSWYSHYTQLDTLTRSSAVANANRVAFLGDSITALNGTGDNVTTFEGTNDNWSSLLPVLSGGRIQWGRSFATGGLMLSEIRDIVLPRLLAQPAAQLPGTCVVLGGTNDAGAAGGTFSLTTSISALTDIITSLRNALIRPVLCTVPPRGDSSSANQNANRLNAAIIGLARKLGLPLLDHHSALVSASTGAFASGMDYGDGVHPSAAGMMAMAQAAIDDGFDTWLPPWSPPLVRTTVDPVDLAAGQGLFLTDTNADGLGNGWSSFTSGGTATATASIVAPTAGDNNLGQWQRFVRSTPAQAGTIFYQLFIPTSGVAATGDLLSLDARIRWTGLTGAGFSSTNSPRISLAFRDSGNGGLDALQFGATRDLTGVLHLDRRVPASSANIVIDIAFPGPSAGSPTLDFGQVTIRNLTALGLA